MAHDATPEQIKHASDQIIVYGVRPWNFEKQFMVNLKDPRIEHVDLMEVAPGKGSLKLYGARLHSKTIRGLPYPPETILTDEQKQVVKDYCVNDLALTVDLYTALKTQLDLRDAMSESYGVDLRSKSDAQVAEAVIKSEIEKLTARKVEKPGLAKQFAFKYTMPPWVRLSDTALLEDIADATYTLSDTGKVIMPEELENRKLVIGRGVYRMGIGGLHSSEKKVEYHADKDYVLIDRDVASYYPRIILNLGLYPKTLGPVFLAVYDKIVKDRLAAKKAKQTVIAESLKITINGSFGKFGNMYSILYSPELMIQVTLTGQLALLMLIDRLEELADVTVVSANTDGIFIRAKRTTLEHVNGVVHEWERVTGFETEETEYSALYARDVNNYVAVKTDGVTTKTKGAYGAGVSILQKNPVNQICTEALLAYLTLGADIETTIACCRDVRKFLTVRQVNGGADYRGEDLGKVVRWYYATGETEALHYRTNGNKVPKSDGARPLMWLDGGFPADVNLQWYVNEAYNQLEELEVTS